MCHKQLLLEKFYEKWLNCWKTKATLRRIILVHKALPQYYLQVLVAVLAVFGLLSTTTFSVPGSAPANRSVHDDFHHPLYLGQTGGLDSSEF